MKICKAKTMATLIAFILTLTMAIPLVALPFASAHTPALIIPTWCYIGVAPNIIGVGQEVLVVFWLDAIPPTAVAEFGDRWKFTVEVTKPDGNNEILGPITSDPVGGGYTMYTPTQMGTYTFVAKFPDTVITGKPLSPINPTYGQDSVNDTYSASTSEPVTVNVQQASMPNYQETPLPTDYWTRPIYGANRDWYLVAGQWLGGADPRGRINAFTQGPESSHILWARPYWSGGVMGGGASTNFGSTGYYTGLSYEGFGGPSIILDGRVYYTVQTPPREGWFCVDLYTGETIYFRNTTGPISQSGSAQIASGSFPYGSPAFGQIYNYESPNQHGGFGYLWVTSTGKAGTWDMLDEFTGNYICSIANVSTAGTQVYGKDGSILYYNIAGTGANQHLTVWNNTWAIWYPMLRISPSPVPVSASTGNWLWRPFLNGTYDGNYGFSLNISIPNVQGSILAVREGVSIIGGTSGTNNEYGVVQGNLWALSLKPGEEGRLLWNETFTPPKETIGAAAPSNRQAGRMTMGTVDPEDGVFLFSESKTRRWWVYSLDTMQQLWTSESEPQMEFYGMSSSIYGGRLFSYGYSGIISYNITTGNIDWNWTAPFVGLGETPWPQTPISMGCIADGKLYVYSTEHSPTQPLRRDAKLYCVDAESGKLIWAETCWPSAAPIIADGRIVVLDLFDNMIYCYGRGSSATTVSAPQTVPALGSSVMITGTVADNTPSGRLNTNGGVDFQLKGTPAIADESMDAWMEYMYHQRPIPTNAKGVEVILQALDPNGNSYEIGRTTSDSSGNYGLTFTPEVPGKYQIIAMFDGSAAYGSSRATTYVAVGEQAPTSSPYPVTSLPPTEIYFAISTAAIIISIAIATALMMLRKRP